jgi:hypothetical protein
MLRPSRQAQGGAAPTPNDGGEGVPVIDDVVRADEGGTVATRRA